MGGGGWKAHLLKNHGERGSRLKKNHWARGLSNIEKLGAGGGGGLPGKKNNIGCGVNTIYTEKSQVGCQDTAIKCCTPLLENEAGCFQKPKESIRLQISVNEI